MKYSATHLLIQGEENLKNYNEWIINSFLRYVTVTNKTQVLDFGAGIGTLSRIWFAKTGLRPHCVEIDPDQRAFIEKSGFKTYNAIDDTCEKYDIIFTSNVLEHIKDDVKTLSNIRTKLVSSGVLIIFVPALEIIWSSMDVQVGHHRRYKRASLLNKLESTGYKVQHIQYCDSAGFILSFLFKYIGSSNGEPSPISLRFFDNIILPVSKALDTIACGKFGKNILAIATPNNSLE